MTSIVGMWLLVKIVVLAIKSLFIRLQASRSSNEWLHFSKHWNLTVARISGWDSNYQSHTVKQETFQGENFRKLVKKTIFAEKTFADCLLVSCQRCHTPKFCRENFLKWPQNHKFAKVFYLESFPLYGTHRTFGYFTWEGYLCTVVSATYLYITVNCYERDFSWSSCGYYIWELSHLDLKNCHIKLALPWQQK